MASFNVEVSGGNQTLIGVSPDVHNSEVFLAHKENGCQIPPSCTSVPNADVDLKFCNVGQTTSAITSQVTDSPQTLIWCNLDDLDTLIQEGGTEVTLGTEGDPLLSTSSPPPDVVGPLSQELPKPPEPAAPVVRSDEVPEGMIMSHESLSPFGTLLISSMPSLITLQDYQTIQELTSFENTFPFSDSDSDSEWDSEWDWILGLGLGLGWGFESDSDSDFDSVGSIEE